MKKLCFLLLTVVVAVIWASCSSSSGGYDTTESVEYSMTDEAPAMESMPEGELLNDAEVEVDDERMIIKTANLRMQTTEFDVSLANIKAEIEKYGGEITNSDLWRSGDDSYEYRVMDIEIRVPAENYSSLLSGVESAANVRSMNEYSEDVTTQYIDVTARIDSLKAQEERLIELLDMAQNITEIMEIEYQLSNVRYERESYEQQRIYLERQTSMSTIYLTLEESRVVVITDEGFWTGLGTSFMSGYYWLTSALSALLTVIVTLLPTLIFIAIIAVIVIVIVKATKPLRKNKPKKQPMPIQPMPYPQNQPMYRPGQYPMPGQVVQPPVAPVEQQKEGEPTNINEDR